MVGGQIEYYYWLLGMVRKKDDNVIEGMLGQQFCKKTIGLALFTRFHYIIRCLASVVGAS